MSSKAERITYRPEGERARTIYLVDATEIPFIGATAVTGIEVDRDGNRTLGPATQPLERRHVIASELIVKRVPVVMDNTYGEYVEA